ncbi:hypothetical protein FHW69_002811 [Luteibacter sp. Sphag1AF]|uniref:hypothetical protein n=1 Tax=Luteibacter sp. Sphag1AF TaxID=2587031 RepID=UPI001620C597|nr:hypothetical protein [Luteibacter sp. Sphag1AF]MBB3228176.1 hypothetical protein [Luteibacter sp. Sphag1AF]
MDPEPADAQWIAWFDSGQLTAHLKFDDSDVAGLARLHNEGRLDLLSLVDTGQVQALDDMRFFEVAGVLERLLPDLEASAERLMTVVAALVQRGGADLASNTPNTALRAWFARRPAEARRVIAQAAQGHESSTHHLTFALEALEDAAQARVLTATRTGACRIGALTALSRIVDSPDGYRASLEVLAELDCAAEGADLAVEQQAFITAASIHARATPAVAATAVATLEALLRRYPQSLAAAVVYALWSQPTLLDTPLFPHLLEVAATADASHAGVVRQLDEVARRLVAAGRAKDAADLVGTMIVGSGGTLSGRAFKSFMHATLAVPPNELGQLAINWLLSEDAALCEMLHEMLGQGELEGRPLAIDADAFPQSYEELMFLCGKAAGWLMFVPVSATSVLCAAVRATDGTQREEIGQLLTDLLFDNYHCASEYAQTLVDAEPPWACLQPFLETSRAYLDRWKEIPAIPELAPSDEHRRVQHLKRTDEMREVHKSAHEQSLFASLFKRAVILHGSGMAMMLRDADGSSRRMDTPMGSFSVSKEIPRQLAIDPIGFDLTLRTLRVGKRPA